ncbi:MAG: hypothetical protein R3A80_07425 [Bdellovibrionota bacterium]
MLFRVAFFLLPLLAMAQSAFPIMHSNQESNPKTGMTAPSQDDVDKLKKDAAFEKDREKIGKDWDRFRKEIQFARDSLSDEHNRLEDSSVFSKEHYTGTSLTSKFNEKRYESSLNSFGDWISQVQKDDQISDDVKLALNKEFELYTSSYMREKHAAQELADGHSKVTLGRLATLRDSSLAAAGVLGAVAIKGSGGYMGKVATSSVAGAGTGAAFDALKGHADAWSYASEKAASEHMSFSEKLSTYFERRGDGVEKNPHPTGAVVGAGVGAAFGAAPSRFLAAAPVKGTLVAAGLGLGGASMYNESMSASDYEKKADSLLHQANTTSNDFLASNLRSQAADLRSEAKAATARGVVDGASALLGAAVGLSSGKISSPSKIMNPVSPASKSLAATVAANSEIAPIAAQSESRMAVPVNKPRAARFQPTEIASAIPYARNASMKDKLPEMGRFLPPTEKAPLVLELNKANATLTPDKRLYVPRIDSTPGARTSDVYAMGAKPKPMVPYRDPVKPSQMIGEKVTYTPMNKVNKKAMPLSQDLAAHSNTRLGNYGEEGVINPSDLNDRFVPLDKFKGFVEFKAPDGRESVIGKIAQVNYSDNSVVIDTPGVQGGVQTFQVPIDFLKSFFYSR